MSLQHLLSAGTLRRAKQYYYLQVGHSGNHRLHNNPETHLIRLIFVSHYRKL